jgi:septum formation protein
MVGCFKNMSHSLLLGSQSKARQQLLRSAGILFSLLEQNADEAAFDHSLPLEKVVQAIALHKMNLISMPPGTQSQVAYVLTADTLVQDHDGVIHGKPRDRADARKKLLALHKARIATAFCLDKKIFINNSWQIQDRIKAVVSAYAEFVVPEQYVDAYLDQIPFQTIAGAMAIEGYGAQFLEQVEGSYSTIMGLPLFEVRQALEALGFFVRNFSI